jgi:hypothetical protein
VNLPKFFAELKRRNVYKVAVAYAVAAWLLMQGASILRTQPLQNHRIFDAWRMVWNR